MKKIIILSILLIGIVGLVSAQGVTSKYENIQYDPAVANVASGVGDRTVLELRDYGIDLFISGMVLNVVAPSVIVVVSTVAGGASGTDIASGFTGAIGGLFIGNAIGALVGVAGFGMWVAGAVYWGRGNRLLAGGGLALTDPQDDVLVVFQGTQITLRY